MKKTRILITVVLIVAGLLIGNWIYGNILSKKIENQLERQIELVFEGAEVTFDKVNVNPLFSKLEFYGLQIVSDDGVELFSSTEAKLGMPYSEAMRLLKSKNFEEVKTFSIHLFDSAVFIEGVDDKLLVDDLYFSFKGHLTKQDLEQLNDKFPDQKQAVKVDAKGLSFADTPWMDALGFTSEQINRFNKIDKLTADLRFNPDKQIIQLNDVLLHSPLATYTSVGELSYEGEGLEKMKVTHSSSSIELKLNDKGIEWGDPETNGKYSLDNLYVKMDGDVSYEDSLPQIHSQSTQLLLENLSVEYAGAKKAELEAQTALLGLKMDKLTVKKLAISSKIENDLLVISQGELLSSLMNAELEAKIKIDERHHKASQIEKATLIVSELAPGIENALTTFELMTMQSLPRKGKSIVLEMSGDVTRPTIKGLRY
ncbi:hypothetical protein J1N10_13525 [Carboxylicivirga sp. A043]|uniref:hypothetical protein n=1 Tax=Carboxylicivirga litoralis TaxID=2816963 RepID=UPI0021CB82FE|nr:hypothetical protein [Carboxylicivirga sp. A043]MCU4157004.1 hypothetical protein [Carboxylicivirga sp. A043]